MLYKMNPVKTILIENVNFVFLDIEKKSTNALNFVLQYKIIEYLEELLPLASIDEKLHFE